MYGGTFLAGGTGSVTYLICNTSTSTSRCLVPSNYSIYAQDSSENLNSPAENLTVTPVYPTLSIGSASLKYGQSDQISSKAPNQNDNLELLIDGTQVASGTGNVTYTFCVASQHIPCLYRICNAGSTVTDNHNLGSALRW